jgi:hypothetical protein
MTVHTGDLDHAMVAALHTDSPHADAVSFKVLKRAEDGVPTLYRVTVTRAAAQFIAEDATPTGGLERAMQLLRAAAGVVELAWIVEAS